MSARALGALIAVLTLVADQGNKLWLIFVYGIEERQPVRLASFLDIVFAKNPGISYSLFRAHTAAERLALLAFTLAATVFLAVWLWRAKSRLVGVALGLIVGGALGNAFDRFAYGYVADFYYFHVGAFSWYVFNLADAAIVAGVGLLLVDALFGRAPEESREKAGAG